MESVSKLPATMRPPITASPAVNEPVTVFSHPMITGPKKPPIVPTELMNAKPPAAPSPSGNAEESTRRFREKR